MPGATHLFEEPGTLEEVARLAADWFLRHLRGDTMTVFWNTAHGLVLTPVEAALHGALAGLTALVLLRLLSLVLPGARTPPRDPGEGSPWYPRNPHDPQQVREWQERMQSPAAFPGLPRDRVFGGRVPTERVVGATPAGALAQPRSPGPEYFAEQFAYKVASGIFDFDISSYLRLAGIAVHLAYGMAWGVLYGLIQASYRWPPVLFGLLFGLTVWLIGRDFLVPAMKLMRPLAEESPRRAVLMLAGHIVYGLVVAVVFEASSAALG